MLSYQHYSRKILIIDSFIVLLDCNLFAHSHGKFIFLTVVTCINYPTICFFVRTCELFQHTFPRICHWFVIDVRDNGTCVYTFRRVCG